MLHKRTRLDQTTGSELCTDVGVILHLNGNISGRERAMNVIIGCLKMGTFIPRRCAYLFVYLFIVINA
jgi:hypothetical protein